MNRMVKESLIIMVVLAVLAGGFMILEHDDVKNYEAERIELEKDNEEIAKLEEELKDKEARILELESQLDDNENDAVDKDKISEMEAEIAELKEWKRTRQQYINYLYKELYE